MSMANISLDNGCTYLPFKAFMKAYYTKVKAGAAFDRAFKAYNKDPETKTGALVRATKARDDAYNAYYDLGWVKEEILDHWEQIVNVMDDGLREEVHMEICPCTELEFLALYLSWSKEDLVIG